MTLNEAIEHCKKVAKDQENCNKGCSLEHRQLAIWLSDLKAITENSYEEFKCETNKYAHDYTLIALQGRLAVLDSIFVGLQELFQNNLIVNIQVGYW